jgi:hypothetical protein
MQRSELNIRLSAFVPRTGTVSGTANLTTQLWPRVSKKSYIMSANEEVFTVGHSDHSFFMAVF